MGMNTYLRDLDVVMLTFDEPAADANFAELQKILPQAKRSHGVKGFDAAHLAAASLATGDIFVTVDGDSIVNPAILELYLKLQYDKDFVVSLNAVNSVNGLAYGNGSIKIWSKGFIQNMNCHERAPANADKSKKIDFCWLPGFFSTRNTHYSTTIINGDPYQAWRAGYREGIKMILIYAETGEWKEWHQRHFLTWCAVGADVDNGIDAMTGAVSGAYDLLIGSDYTLCNDNDWLKERYKQFCKDNEFAQDANRRCELGACLGLATVPALGVDESRWSKACHPLPRLQTCVEIR